LGDYANVIVKLLILFYYIVVLVLGVCLRLLLSDIVPSIF